MKVWIDMFPLKPEEIAALDAGSLERLAALDAQGIMLGPGECAEEFKERLSALERELAELDRQLLAPEGAELFKGVTLRPELAIPAEIMEEAAGFNLQAYAFSAAWVPGFFLSKSLGALWGGCAIVFNSGLRVFIIRAAFAKAKSWLIYRREELLSHELCHAARAQMNDRRFEELFAYRLSFSKFRRRFGDCFQSSADALLFLCPVILLLAVQLSQTFFWPTVPVWPFWLLAFAYPLWLLLRSGATRRAFERARAVLAPVYGEHVDAVLFRCSRSEIEELAAMPAGGAAAWAAVRVASELRWKVIDFRFGAKAASEGLDIPPNTSMYIGN